MKTLDKSQVELTITVTPDEYEKQLKQAATRLSGRMNIKGFRKGKAPYDVVVKEAGDMAIFQEAIEPIVQATYPKIVVEEKLDTVGMPKIEIEKMAPGNDLVYKATVALLPKVTLPDLKKIDVKIEDKTITDADVNETIDALRGMHATEVVTDKPATDKDKVVIDMNMKIDNVPMEGGQAKDHQVYLSEDHYIPGFNEKLIGVKKGDEKEFSITFPEKHHNKNFAGKKVDFDVKVKDVYERHLAELNDEFAKKLGKDTVNDLKEIIRSNREHEAIHKAEEKAEIEILEKLIEKTKFEDIPEVLIDAERQKIFLELRSDLEKHGIPLDKYLEDIKKSEKELFEDFKVQAEKRAKAALISREVAKENDIMIDDKEIDEEIDMLKNVYQDREDYLERLKRPEVRDTIAVQLQNKKVMQFLKETILGKDNLHMHGEHDHDEHHHEEEKKKKK